MIKCGGFSFPKVLLGLVGVIIGSVVVAVVGGASGSGAVVTIGYLLITLVTIGFFVLLMWNTATRRGLSGWWGILCCIPVVNLFVYPYMAFHDGFVAPNKLGLGLGLLLICGPAWAQYSMISKLTNDPQGFLQAQLEQGMGEMDPDAQAQMQQAMGAMGAMMEIGMDVAQLESLDGSDPAEMQELREGIEEVHAKLDSNAGALGSEAVAQLREGLKELEARAGVPSRGPAASGAAGLAAASTSGLTQIWSSSPPAHIATASADYDSEEGFNVPDSPPCPPGATQLGGAPPNGHKQWCEQLGGGLKHGWYTEWYDSGERAVAGEYREGLRVGVWTRWYQDGTKRAQAEFENGMQDGVLIAWDQQGIKSAERHFRDGEPVRQ
jgi:hypothetical protein